MNSNMLLKVKPDGPVYEVQFTSQLICMPHNTVSVGSTELQTVPTSEIISDATVTSDSSTYPVVSSVPAVTASHREVTMRNGVAESSRMHQSSAASTQQIQTCPSTYYDRQPLSDSVLNCKAASIAARHAAGNAADTETLENFTATASTVCSDVVCRQVTLFY